MDSPLSEEKDIVAQARTIANALEAGAPCAASLSIFVLEHCATEIEQLREGLAEAVAGLRRARSLLEDATTQACRKAGLVLRD